jgi:hypothetical protein
VRVIDFIRGTDLLTYLDSLAMQHEEYCHTCLPVIMAEVKEILMALQCLHEA